MENLNDNLALNYNDITQTKVFTIPGINAEFYQSKNSQSVSSDSQILYETVSSYIRNVSPNHNLKILDIGSGNGILLLMLAKEFHSYHYYGIEIIDYLNKIAIQNFNSLQKSLDTSLNYSFICDNYNNKTLMINKFDIIVSNPPYFPKYSGKISSSYEKAIARFEIEADLKDLINCITNNLHKNGKAFLLYPFTRYEELIFICKAFNLSCRIKKSFPESNKNLCVFELEYAKF